MNVSVYLPRCVEDKEQLCGVAPPLPPCANAFTSSPVWTLNPQGTLSDSTGQDGARESHRAIQAALGGKQPEEPVLGE